MQIEKCIQKTKCDFAGCNNLATYSLSTKGILKRELCFCDDCLREIYEAIGKTQVPKGVKSPFKQNERLRRNNERRG